MRSNINTERCLIATLTSCLPPGKFSLSHSRLLLGFHKGSDRGDPWAVPGGPPPGDAIPQTQLHTTAVRKLQYLKGKALGGKGGQAHSQGDSGNMVGQAASSGFFRSSTSIKHNYHACRRALIAVSDHTSPNSAGRAENHHRMG